MTASVEPGRASAAACTGRGSSPASRWRALIAAAGFRSSTGALLEPLEEEFGWSRATTSGAVSLNLVLYGLTAPFAAALMERFGIRRVVAAASLVAARLRATLRDDLAVAAVAAVGLRRRASAPARWPWCSARSWPTAGSSGTAAWWSASSRRPARPGSWCSCPRSPTSRPARAGAGRRAWSAASRCARAAGLVVLRDQPADVGTTPYGARGRPGVPPRAGRRGPQRRGRAAGPAHAARERRARAPSGSCSATFWICGWSTNGLIGTHFIPAAHDHGMPRDHQREPARADRDLRHRRHGRQRLADRPGRLALPAVRLLLLPRAVAAGRAVAARAGRAPEPVRLHRVLRPRLGGDRAADGRAVPPALRARALRRRVRLGVRRAHGRRGRRRALRRLDPDHPGRLLLGLDDRRRPVCGRGRGVS